MRWQVTAIAWTVLGVVVSATLPARAADGAPEDADLAKEAAATTDAASVDAGTGKTLQERIRAVSRRTFLKQGRFELTPVLAISTSDPFFRAWTVGARGAYHFSEEFALDFGGSGAVFNEALDIFRVSNLDEQGVKDLFDDLEAATLLGVGDVGVTFSPFYGKVNLAGELVGHFDTFVSGGAGVVVDAVGNNVGVRPALEVGIGSRLYLTRWLAARADVRSYLYPADSAGELAFGNLVMVNVGAAFYFPLDFDYANETLGAKD